MLPNFGEILLMIAAFKIGGVTVDLAGHQICYIAKQRIFIGVSELNHVAVCLHLDEAPLPLGREEFQRVVDESAHFDHANDVDLALEPPL